jgi:hypothetical protein
MWNRNIQKLIEDLINEVHGYAYCGQSYLIMCKMCRVESDCIPKTRLHPTVCFMFILKNPCL